MFSSKYSKILKNSFLYSILFIFYQINYLLIDVLYMFEIIISQVWLLTP